MHHPATSSSPPHTRFPAFLLFGLIAIAAMVVLAFSTAGGLNVDDDGLCYIEGARNIAAGNGYQFGVPPLPTAPVTHFPPLLPALIAIFTWLVGDPHSAARWVNVLCLGAQVWLACWLVWKATSRVSPALLAGAALALHVHALEHHAWAFSEPLFVALGFAIIAALVRFGETQSRRWLLAAGLLASGSALARYSGMVWVGLTPLLVLYVARGSWRQRLVSAVLCGAAAMALWLAWSIRNSVAGGSVMNRSVQFHLISGAHIHEGLTTISTWFLPWRFMGPVTGAGCMVLSFALVGALLWKALRKPDSSPFTTVAVGLGSFFFLYLAHLPVAISLLHFNTPLDARLLLPALAMVLCGLGLLPSLIHTRGMTVAVVMILSGLVAFEAARAYPWALKNRRGESGSFGTAWRQHPAMKFLRDAPENTRIYSYNRRLLWAVLHRPVHPIPAKRSAYTTAVIPESKRELHDIGAAAITSPALLVYVHPNRPEQSFSPDEGHDVELGHAHEFPLAEIQESLTLRPAFEHKGVSIYQIEGPAAPVHHLSATQPSL